MFKVKYGDNYLTDYVKFTKIERGVASENNLTTEENSSDGVEIVSVKEVLKISQCHFMLLMD